MWEEYAPAEYDEAGGIQYEPPPLDNIWLSEGKRQEKRVNLQRRQVREQEQWIKNQEQAEKVSLSPKLRNLFLSPI
jgi:hypothetical protein